MSGIYCVARLVFPTKIMCFLVPINMYHKPLKSGIFISGTMSVTDSVLAIFMDD